MITKAELIEMVEKLQAKKKAANQVLRKETLLESIAHIERYNNKIQSICDRLVLNWNMLDYPNAEKFLKIAINEAKSELK